MAAQGFLLLASYLLVLLVLARPLGMCLARMVNDIPLPGLAGVERVLWRVAGIRAEEMGWLQYLLAILLFNALGGLALFALLMLQGVLPFNPQHLPGLSWDLALNTAISFVSNTNWQAYAGESTMSYLSQMVGLTVQNFLSAATGIAVVFALTRAFARQKMSTLGNAWVDLTRITLWLLLPLSLLVALFFIQQGVPQNLQAYQPFTTLEGVHQLLPMGPVASQEAIKLLGTNGGGFFNANSAHPFENPTALTNLVQMLAIFLIPAALCFAFGEVVSDRRQGRAILWAMTLIFILCVAVVMWAETRGNPHLLTLGADSSLNMEGKEITEPQAEDLGPADRWILSACNNVVKDVTENLDKFELGIALSKIYDFIWDEFCDWYIELSKYAIYHADENPKSANAALWTLKKVLGDALKLLHPYMPFVTEEIYSKLVPEEESLMISSWPVYEEKWNDAENENILNHYKEIVRGVRNVRSEMNVPNSRKATIYVVCEDEKLAKGLAVLKESAMMMASAGDFIVQADKSGIADDAVSVVVPDATVYVPLEELIDFEQEKERLTKEETRLNKEIARSNGMLNNEKFVCKAPAAKVQEEREKLEKYEQMLAQVKERLAGLQKK